MAKRTHVSRPITRKEQRCGAFRAGTWAYVIWQCTWGLPQTLLGAVLFLLNRRRCPVRWYHGAVVTEWQAEMSASFGMFVFVTAHPTRDRRRQGRIPVFQLKQCLLVHEYGHTIQSLFFGPLYLPLMAIPSAAWGYLPYFRRKRERGAAYSDFFTESLANRLGEWVTGERSLQGALL